jgi:peptide deformylase
MYEEGGVGLAAPQVGWTQRIVIVDTTWQGDKSQRDPTVLINPVLSDLQGEQEVFEACLSVPWPGIEVKRAEECVLTYRDLEWEEQEIYLEGFEAAVAQHEIDHLDGKLYIDRISRLKRDILKRKAKKIRRAAEKNLHNQVT